MAHSEAYNEFYRQYVKERPASMYEEAKDGSAYTSTSKGLTPDEIAELRELLRAQLAGKGYHEAWVMGLKALGTTNLAAFLESLLEKASTTEKITLIEHMLALGHRKTEHLDYLLEFTQQDNDLEWIERARKVFRQYR